jgi:hypothetical protein
VYLKLELKPVPKPFVLIMLGDSKDELQPLFITHW